jgi:hypothetical protein
MDRRELIENIIGGLLLVPAIWFLVFMAFCF